MHCVTKQALAPLVAHTPTHCPAAAMKSVSLPLRLRGSELIRQGAMARRRRRDRVLRQTNLERACADGPRTFRPLHRRACHQGRWPPPNERLRRRQACFRCTPREPRKPRTQTSHALVLPKREQSQGGTRSTTGCTPAAWCTSCDGRSARPRDEHRESRRSRRWPQRDWRHGDRLHGDSHYADLRPRSPALEDSRPGSWRHIPRTWHTTRASSAWVVIRSRP